jgi:prepilin signal peptidase PulO-like enzyme (type II secretory pathway)
MTMSFEAYYLRITLVVCILAIAVWRDVKTHTIPNLLTLPAAAMGMAFGGWLEGTGGVVWALQGLIAGAALFLPFYVLGAAGAGDIKLLAALGTFLGPAGAILAGGLSLVAGSLIGIVQRLKNQGGTAANTAETSGWSPQEQAGMAYAPAIAIGCLGALLWATH